MTARSKKIVPTVTHWGNYKVEVDGDQLVAVHRYDVDRNPTPIGECLLEAKDSKTRIARPVIRKGYLQHRERGDGLARGCDPFVAVPWDEALDIAAEALESARSQYGNESIYGGSYGWASAGRFHHAQSQVHRFLNCAGGYTKSVTTYSVSAAEVIIPHILGFQFGHIMFQAPTVDDMIEQTKLVVCFGGIPLKNTQVNAGSLGQHDAADQLKRLSDAGIDFINVGPIRDDMTDEVDATWWPCRPNSDVAIMLAVAYVLITEDLVDHSYVDRYCTGFDRFAPYVLGSNDGVAKAPEWAAALSEIPASEIRALARRMAADKTVIGISWSIQRAEHGEQTYWMATVLAALLGSHGLPGAGIAYGYGSVHNIGFMGRKLMSTRVSALPQGENPVDSYIPVSRVADMLLNPGGSIDYNGAVIEFPDIRVVYWAGGNPFHHHQDLARLRKAWAKPDCIIVNEPFWTATARHADIVFPVTTPLERNDYAGGTYDNYLSPMHQAVSPFRESRNDYDVFTGLGERLNCADSFTQGRSEMQWVEHLYEITRQDLREAGVSIPDFAEFWQGEQLSLRDKLPDSVFHLERFRADPEKHALNTPSGRIEIFSETIDSFRYDDCLGHPAWFDKTEWLGSVRADDYPLHLISNQPKTRLHSQYDHAANSRNAKIKQREIARMHPADAAARSIKDGDIVRLFNDRGACLAAAVVSDSIRQSVVELPTGAWYDPEDPANRHSLDVHGNPNVLTRDVGTSKLAQGPTAHSCLVEIEKFVGDLPPVKAFEPPPIE